MGARGAEDNMVEKEREMMHVECLKEAQRRIAPIIGSLLTQRGFYLAGGTAIALHLGHRESVDFDFFVSGPIVDPGSFTAYLRDTGINVTHVATAVDTLHCSVDSVKLSLFGYRYPLVGEPVEWSEAQVNLASLDDLACMKLAAVTQRGARKDFVDIHAIVTCHRPLGELLELFKRKYSTDEVAHILVALSYFDDAEAEPMPRMHVGPDWEHMKRDLAQWARSISG